MFFAERGHPARVSGGFMPEYVYLHLIQAIHPLETQAKCPRSRKCCMVALFQSQMKRKNTMFFHGISCILPRIHELIF
jgi:hypothetical protein